MASSRYGAFTASMPTIGGAVRVPIRYRSWIGDIQQRVDMYVNSIEYDVFIAKEVVKTLKAHVEELCTGGLIPKKTCGKLVSYLRDLGNDPEELINYAKARQFEDIHEALESLLYDTFGEETGWAYLGRSRNDHVAAALRLKVVEETMSIIESMLILRRTLLAKAKENKRTLFVTHTHFQPAQATPFSHYLASFEEELADVTSMMLNDLHLIAKSPLGAAAGAGTCVPLDREALARRIGFEDNVKNPLYATGSRLFLQRFLQNLVLASLPVTRLLNDLYLFSNPSLALVEIPARHTQTSSLMPHKRNPATVEVARARLSEVLSRLVASMTIEMRLPSGYSLDLQEASPHAWEASRVLRGAIEMLTDIISEVRVNESRVNEYIRKNINGVTEAVEVISLEKKIPFRQAHRTMGEALAKNSWDVERTLEVIAEAYGLDKEKIAKIKEPDNQIKCRKTAGSFEYFDHVMRLQENLLESHEQLLKELLQKFKNSA